MPLSLFYSVAVFLLFCKVVRYRSTAMYFKLLALFLPFTSHGPPEPPTATHFRPHQPLASALGTANGLFPLFPKRWTKKIYINANKSFQFQNEMPCIQPKTTTTIRRSFFPVIFSLLPPVLMQPRYDTVFSLSLLLRGAWTERKMVGFFFKSTKISLKRSAIISFHYFIFSIFPSVLSPFFHWLRLCWVREDVHIALSNALKSVVYDTNCRKDEIQ